MLGGEIVSRYLNKEIRDRSVIASDLVNSAQGGWDKTSVIADSLDVILAVLVYAWKWPGCRLTIRQRIADPLRDIGPANLQVKNLEVLLDSDGHAEVVTDLIDELKDTGHADAYVAYRRKNGTRFGCHLLAHRAKRTSSNKQISYHTLLSVCDIASSH